MDMQVGLCGSFSQAGGLLWVGPRRLRAAWLLHFAAAPFVDLGVTARRDTRPEDTFESCQVTSLTAGGC